MANKSKEKNKKKNTKDNDLLNLDNEIIIGIKTLPEPEIPKNKKISSKKRTKKRKNKTVKPNVNNTKMQNEKNKPLPEKKKTRKLTQKEEMARKKRKRIFRLIKWTTLIAIIIGGLVYFLLSPYFNVKTILTSGNEKVTKEEIISLSGIQLEQNMFKLSNNKVKKAIKNNAYVDSVNLKRKLPDTIELQIVERKPAYMLTLGNAYVYINTQGYLLEISKQALEFPIITGYLTPENQIQPGNRLCEEDLQRLSAVIQIMDVANNNELGNIVTKINIQNKQNYILELKSEKKTVHLGDTSNLSTKMLYIKKVIEKEKKNEGEIFVNTDLNTKGAIFREKV